MADILVDEKAAALLHRMAGIRSAREFVEEIAKLLRSGDLEPETVRSFVASLPEEDRNPMVGLLDDATLDTRVTLQRRTIAGVVKVVDVAQGRAVIVPDTGSPKFLVVKPISGAEIGELHENQHVVAEVDEESHDEPLAVRIVQD